MKIAIEKSEKQIAELKLDRSDIINHIKMSNTIKKSKNSAVKVSAISEDPKTEDKNPKKK